MRVLAWPYRQADNPYTPLLYSSLRELGVDVAEFSPKRLLLSPGALFHVHWPELVLKRRSAGVALFRTVALFLLLLLARLRGTKVIWTAHNLHAHERRHPRLEEWFWHSFTRLVDGYITLSKGATRQAIERFPHLRSKPAFVVPHGHYRTVYPRTRSRLEAREELGIPANAPVIGFIGQIRPYKGVAGLITAFRSLEDPDAVLVVAGEPKVSGIREDLIASAGDDPRIRLFLGFVPDSDMQLYLLASDLVVLPFHSVMNSGSALLALSFDRPVLLPELGAMAELRDTVGADWVMTYTGKLTSGALSAALDWAFKKRESRCDPLDRMDWIELAHQTLDAYGSTLAGHAPQRPLDSNGV